MICNWQTCYQHTLRCKLSLLAAFTVLALSGCGGGTPAPAALPTLTIAAASVTEGNAGTANLVFTVTSSAAAATDITVNYATSDGTAVAGSDYTATNGTLTIAAGATSGTVTVLVSGDTVVEPDETLTLSAPANVTLGTATITGTIINDDVAPPPTLSVAATSVLEGNAGTANLVFTVTLSAASASAVTVNFATTDGTAAAASDYTVTNGTLTIAAGATTGTVTVPVSGDTVVEPDETLTLTLSAPTNATIATAAATGTITNDDVAPPLPTLSVAPTSVLEGNAGTANLAFTVTLSSASPNDVTVNYATTDGTATAGSDYTATNGTLTITAGATTGTVTVPVSGDTVVELDETLTLTLSTPTNATIATATAIGTITNDDIPTLSVANTSVLEGNVNPSNLVFTVTLNGVLSTNVTVDFITADSTALSASDYNFQTGALTITAGATSGAVTVIVIADTLFESNETLTLTLSNPVNATIATAAATGTILNDDLGLNDTGITQWGDATLNNLTVTQPQFPAQDADKGRDADPATKTNADGKAGFSFTKLAASGAPLANQAAVYGTTPWSCVQDNVTGLMWEVKTTAGAGGTQDANHTYTWYNTDPNTNGGNVGTVNGGTCGPIINCDTLGYVTVANSTMNGGAGLCGFTDWRLPDIGELTSILDLSIANPGPTIDTGYFPNTIGGNYWSASPVLNNATPMAWRVRFNSGDDTGGNKTFALFVLLVRGGP